MQRDNMRLALGAAAMLLQAGAVAGPSMADPISYSSNPPVIHRRGKFKQNQRKQRKGMK